MTWRPGSSHTLQMCRLWRNFGFGVSWTSRRSRLGVAGIWDRPITVRGVSRIRSEPLGFLWVYWDMSWLQGEAFNKHLRLGLGPFILLGMASRTCCSASNMIGEASGLELLSIGSWLLSGACWWVGVSSAPGPVYLHVCRVKGTDLCPFNWQLNLSPLTIWEARREVWLNRHGEGSGIGKWTWAESRVRSLITQHQPIPCSSFLMPDAA